MVEPAAKKVEDKPMETERVEILSPDEHESSSEEEDAGVNGKGRP